MPVVAERFGCHVDGASRSVENPNFVAELLLYQSVHFHSEVESHADVRCHGIKRIRQDNG